MQDEILQKRGLARSAAADHVHMAVAVFVRELERDGAHQIVGKGSTGQVGVDQLADRIVPVHRVFEALVICVGDCIGCSAEIRVAALAQFDEKSVIDVFLIAQDFIEAVDEQARFIQRVYDGDGKGRWPERLRDAIGQDFKEPPRAFLKQRDDALFVRVEILLGSQETPKINLFLESEMHDIPFNLREPENDRFRTSDSREQIRAGAQHVFGKPFCI